MKIRLPLLFPCIVAALSFNAVSAQDYEHLTVTSGFSADVIANGAGNASASTSIAIDAANYDLMANDFVPPSGTAPAYALPATGLIESAVTDELTFQLGSLSSNNSLRIATQNTSGTLVFSNTVSATKLYVLATSGSGQTTNTFTVNFTDDTSQTFTSTVVPDWFFSNAAPVAISSFGRVNRVTNVMENPTGGDPRLYQIAINIAPENQVKMIESIQFTKTSSAEGILNVFAVTAELLGECPSPGNLVAESTANGATIEWDAAVMEPADGYDYYYSDSDDAPGEDTEPTGNVGPDDNAVTLDDLDTGVEYFFWVRSNCGAGVVGPWEMVTFITGQMDTVYNDGDISSDYVGNNTLTVTTANACPGSMSVIVPAGYQIASVSTSYDITTLNGAYQSEQRSLLVCTTNDATEAAITAGPALNAGTASYNRTNLALADGLSGTVDFELRVWRTWGNSAPYDIDCGVLYNKVVDGSWTITITYEPAPGGCDTPDAPEAEDQDFCGATAVEDLVAEGMEGAELHWYLTADGEEELDGETEVSSGTYFVSQSVGICESARTEIEVSVSVTVAPDTAEEVMVCEGTTVFELPSGTLDGADVYWYTEEEGGEPLEDVEVESGTYYVSQSVDGCESERVAVDIVVVEIEAPEYEEVVTVCTGTTIADLQEDTEDLVIYFYTSAGAEEALPETTEIETGTYFVSFGFMDCETERVEADFLAVTAETPEPAENQLVCGPEPTVEDLDSGVEGEAFITWYDEEGNVVIPEDILINGNTYYVSSNVSGCESPTAAVTVTINPTPAIPVGDEEQEFNAGALIGSLEVEFIDGTTQNWYLLDEDVWVEVSPEDALVDGGVYYVTQTIDGCTSDYLVITVNEILGTSSFDISSLKVYPNPASSVLTIACEGNLKGAVVNNLLGQSVIRHSAAGNSLQLNVEKLAEGTYILQVYTETGESATVKFVKE